MLNSLKVRITWIANNAIVCMHSYCISDHQLQSDDKEGTPQSTIQMQNYLYAHDKQSVCNIKSIS